ERQPDDIEIFHLEIHRTNLKLRPLPGFWQRTEHLAVRRIGSPPGNAILTPDAAPDPARTLDIELYHDAARRLLGVGVDPDVERLARQVLDDMRRAIGGLGHFHRF